MSKMSNNGRKALSTRQAPAHLSYLEELSGNQLKLSPEIQSELDKQGLIARWVNAKELYANQGYHKRGWVPYKQKQSDTIANKDFLDGRDPAGIIRRGDCVLAVKKVLDYEKYKNALEAKAELYSNHGKRQAQELRDLARSAGVKTSIEEGYGDDEQEDEE